MIKNKFTILELLIVISTMVILISLFLPAINKAKEKSKAICCTNNLREIGLATFQYIQDNNSWIPLSNNSNHMYRHRAIAEYLNSKCDGNEATLHLVPQYHCPSDTETHGCNPSRPQDYLWQSYGANFEVSGRGNIYEKIERLRKSSVQFNFMDSTGTGLVINKAWEGSILKLSYWSLRHSGRSNVLFFDGHVSSYGIEGAYMGFQFFYGVSSYNEYISL